MKGMKNFRKQKPLSQGIVSAPSADSSKVQVSVPSAQYGMPPQATQASALPAQLQPIFKRNVSP